MVFLRIMVKLELEILGVGQTQGMRILLAFIILRGLVVDGCCAHQVFLHFQKSILLMKLDFLVDIHQWILFLV